ncbi:MAG: RloB family protein [Porcipelethomonas sp.]
MSMKPRKKSDSQKKWMTDRRDRRITIAPEYHLIVTEGTKTEPQYFDGLRKGINRLYKGRISIVIEGIGQGANTLTLLERAQKIVEKEPDKYKHVWLVYDKDDFPKDDFDNTYFKCKSLSENCDSVVYHALWSNECIEYWFLLHYMALDSALHRSEYYPKLTDCLGSKYEKNREDIYALLKPNIKTAIDNAKRVEANNEGMPPSQCTPGTAVYEIFEMLESYLS